MYKKMKRNPWMVEKTVLSTFNVVLNVHVSIDHINLIIKGQSKNKPILVKFTSFRKKLEFLKEAKKLTRNVRISNDYTQETRQTRKLFLPLMFKARQLECEAFLRDDKLVINDQMFSLDQLLQLEQEDKLSTATVSEDSDKDRVPPKKKDDESEDLKRLIPALKRFS